MIQGCTFGAPLTTSTQDVDVQINSLLTDTNNLNADVTAWYNQSPKTNAAFANAWIAWRDRTYDFIKSWRTFTIAPKLAWGFFDNAVAKLKELAGWRNEFEKTSGLRATGVPSNIPSTENFTKDVATILKWVAIGGVVIGAGAVAFKLYTAQKAVMALRPAR